MTARELELQRLCDAVDSIIEPQRLLLVCLTGASPRDACRLNYGPLDDAGGKVSASYKDSAMALYKIAGRELNKGYSQPLCVVIETFLGTVLTEPELLAFKADNPMRYPIKQYSNILEEMADDDPSVAQWLARQ